MGIFSKKAYRVRMRGVNKIEYSEDGKTLTLDGERLAPNEGVSLVYWLLPNHVWGQPSGLQVSFDDKMKIKTNIEKDFEKHGTVVEVEIIKSPPLS